MQKIKVIHHFGAVEFQFIRREGNLVADYLAKTCDASNVDIRIIDIPSVHVNKLLFDEASGHHDV